MENLRRKLNEMVVEAMAPWDNKSTNSDTMQDELSDTFSNVSDIISSISEYASIESHENPNNSNIFILNTNNIKNTKISEKLVKTKSHQNYLLLNSPILNLNKRAPKRWIISRPTEIEWRPTGGVKRWMIKHKPLGMCPYLPLNTFRVYYSSDYF